MGRGIRWRTVREGGRVGSGLHDTDAISRHVEVGEASRRERTRDDHTSNEAERLTLRLEGAFDLLRGLPGLVSERMMDECDDRESIGVTGYDVGGSSRGQSIDHDGGSDRHLGERTVKRFTRFLVELRESAGQRVRDDPRPDSTQFGYHPSVVQIAPGPLIERPGNDQVDGTIGSGHTLAS